jgi:hypothetical protein
MTPPHKSADAAAGASSQTRTRPRAQGRLDRGQRERLPPHRRGQILKILDAHGHKRLTVGSGGQDE